MKIAYSMLFSAVASLAFAAEVEVSAPSELFPSYGNDTVKYVGATATHDGALTLAPSETKQATTISVEQQDVKLSLMGPLAISHLFFKKGPGVLNLAPANGGDVTWANEGSCYSVPTSNPVSWEDGAATGSFMGFNVAEGIVEWSGTGTLSGYNLTVGNYLSAGPKDASLKMTRGKLQIGNLLVLGQGNGLAGNSAESSLVIGSDAEASINAIWSVQSDGGSSWNGLSLLDVSGGLLNVTGYHWLGYGRGTATLRVQNGGTYEQRNANANATAKDDSLKVGDASRHAQGVIEVDGAGSALVVDRMNCTPGYSTVKVMNGGTLATLAPTRDAIRAKSLGGSLEIDGGTICSSTNGVEAEWFPYGERHVVGAQGGIVTTPTIASLGGWTSGSGTLTKRGAGTVSMMPSAASVRVEDGGVAFHAIQNRADDIDCLFAANASVTVSQGAEVRVSGRNALGAMSLEAGDGTYYFGTVGEDHAADQSAWAMVNAAHLRTDGWFCLTDGRIQSKAGATWRTTKMPVNESFEISVDYYVTKLSQAKGAYVPFGVAMVWQNDGTNMQKITSGNYRALGYASSGKTWRNSFALGYDAAAKCMRVSHDDGAGSYFSDADEAELMDVQAIDDCSFTRPMTLVAKYDQPNRKMTFIVRSGSGIAWTYEVENLDLAAKCGASEAYFGLTASDWSSTSCQGEHFVGNIRLSTSMPAAETSVGGVASIAANTTFDAKLVDDSFNKCWSMKRLVHGDGATLNVEGPSDEMLRFSSVSGEGRLVKTGSAGLGLCKSEGMMPGTLKVSAGNLVLCEGGVDLAANASNWKFSSVEAGGFLSADTISVGRAVSVGETFYDNVALRHPLDISKKWTLFWHGKFHAVSAYASKYMSVMLHNDPRGAAACGTENGTSVGVANNVTVAWQGKSNDNFGTGKVYLFKGVDGEEVIAESYSSTINMKVGTGGEGGSGFEDREVDFELSYDPTTKTLRFKMRQGESVFELTPQQIDLSQVVGEQAYLAFGISTRNWFSVNHQISNLRFVYDDEADWAYVNRLELNAGSNNVVLNAADLDQLFKLAETVVAPDGASLVLASTGVSAAVTAGCVECPGMMTQDGGIFLVGSDTFSGVRKWALANGAKLMVPAGVKAQVLRLWNGVERVKSGIYTSENCEFVVGDGQLQVGSGLGITVMVR